MNEDYAFLMESDLSECSKACIKCGVSCPVKDCREWIRHEEDLNCTSIAVKKNGAMTLREVAERLDVSFVRIKQIEDRLLEKVQRGLAKECNVSRAELKEFVLSAFEATHPRE
tara:strand:- start:281 stop:619 length:339 start_codon:yes stop_codon:yes gene_type:complete